MAGNNAIKSVAGVNATNLFQGFCKVVGWSLKNTRTDAGVCLALYDLARLPIAGVDIPKYKLIVPYSATSGQGSPFSEINGIRLPFYNGLSYCILKCDGGGKSSDANSTAVGVDDLLGILDWSVRTD